MRIDLKLIFFLLVSMYVTSCSRNKHSNSAVDKKAIMEMTTFNIHFETDKKTFEHRDSQVEIDFTSKQPGFIKRQSGVDDKGNYVVIVYWESMADALASMNKFMNDFSVADYTQMIDVTTMKMSRYLMDKSFKAVGSQFVEIMSFDVKKGTDMVKFDVLNNRVETDFTGKREGFSQRLVGVNESGRQLVAVYWADKASSDVALPAFMEAAIAKKFMRQMNQNSILMGRYSLLK